MSFTRAQRDAKAGIEPRERVGMCCSQKCRLRGFKRDVPLYRVRESCYRCRACYHAETGYYP